MKNKIIWSRYWTMMGVVLLVALCAYPFVSNVDPSARIMVGMSMGTLISWYMRPWYTTKNDNDN